MIILKVMKNQGFTISLEDTFFEKPLEEGGKGAGGGGCHIDPLSRFRLKKQHVFLLHNGDLYSIYTFQIKSSLI